MRGIMLRLYSCVFLCFSWILVGMFSFPRVWRLDFGLSNLIFKTMQKLRRIFTRSQRVLNDYRIFWWFFFSSRENQRIFFLVNERNLVFQISRVEKLESISDWRIFTRSQHVLNDYRVMFDDFFFLAWESKVFFF